MCGRTRVSLAPEQALRAAGTARWVNRDAYQPSYNAAPGAATPVVLHGPDGLQLQTMRWGLVPSYTKKDERPDFWRMFNARSESVAEKPAFRRLVPARRCLVLVDAFYEWQKQKDGTKQPYHIYLAPPKSEAGSSGSGSGSGSQEGQAAEEAMVFAGLWDVWEGPDGPMHTYTILTTDASKRLEWLHDRMPVILRTKEAQQQWLSTGDKAATGLQKLFVPYNGDDLKWHPVTQQMNKPAFQGPECCKEVKKPSIQSFFQPRRPSSAAAGGKAAAGAASPAAAGAAGAGAAAAAAAAGAGGALPVKQEQAAAVKDEAAPVVKEEAAAAVKEEAVAAAPAGPVKEEQEQRQQQQAAEPAGPAAAAEAVNADEQPAAKPTPKQPHAKQQQPAASASPAGQKRKAPGGSGGGGSGGKGKGGGSASKKAKPLEKLPGQKDVRQFFMKQ